MSNYYTKMEQEITEEFFAAKVPFL